MKNTLKQIDWTIREIQKNEIEINKETFLRVVQNIKTELLNELEDIKSSTISVLEKIYI